MSSPDEIIRLLRDSGTKACIQKTFRHAPDWSAGAALLKAAADELDASNRKLRELSLVADADAIQAIISPKESSR